ncbi:MAG: 16S rRNA (adenine(1518)-N(6)/adenine(1519)-N(6))-dimethyltransferase RsmA [Candidatus Odinarchaeota archaeon]
MTPGTLLTRTKQWLKTHNVRVSKQLGQHYLVNERVLEHIIESANLSQDDRILEIGTGTGALTQALVDHVQQVYTIEKDTKLFRLLSQELESNQRIQVIQGDAVKIEWPQSDKLIANLPYSISSPVLFKFFKSNIPMAVLMLQREFGERLIATPGTKQYGRLTVMATYYAAVELLELVTPESFYPSPEVSSALVRIHRRSQPIFAVKDVNLFGQITTVLFNQRRKKIRTPLKSFLGQHDFQQLQDKIPWLNQRVEELEPGKIAEISNIIYEERQV